MRVSQKLTASAVAGFLALSLTVPAFAQKGAQRGLQGPLPAIFATRLSLTAEQQAKLKAAADAVRAETEKTASLMGKERREAARKARMDYEAAVAAVLTAEQQKQLQTLWEEAAQFSGVGALAPRLVGLNLTDDQKKKVAEIGAKYQPELAKLRASLQGATDRKAIQGQLREANLKMAGEVSAVLTADQQKQFEATAPRGRRKQQQ